ncbi:tRNA (adenosine(37)-N6)-threonylcarbamoyltransferase complex dimerization subunit type 1 TsaB [Salinicoccus sesuvii]|uniref:tRNA (Adenosine(37)-N6)-threonylcarbamoyltransferase complex dimerization subunit type 1 TsaB n=1 Tax=Salinicoccus sesuvii TaxID=868281 RepID=A0ABV7N2H4_9STAP
MISLLIDTSNRPLSVALNKNCICLAEINTTVKKTHSATVMVYINQLFKMTGYNKKNIDRIIVARGPGSYTGVRIGVTVAKTLAYALRVPLYSVSSLAVIASSSNRTGILVPMFDGRRGNVYSAAYQVDQSEMSIRVTEGYRSLDALSEKLEEYPKQQSLLDGDEKFSEKIESYLHTVPRISTIERYVTMIREEDVHSMVPEYLKLSEAEKNWMERTQK